jgi:isatin hydrolase
MSASSASQPASDPAVHRWQPDSELVDLTLPLDEDLPCTWPGHMPFQHKVFNWFETRNDGLTCVSNRRGAYHTRWFMMDEHAGTHVDAPSHAVAPQEDSASSVQIRRSASIGEIPLPQLIGPAARIRIQADPCAVATSPRIETDVLDAFEEEHGKLRGGEIVLLNTGWDARYQSGSLGFAYVEDPVVKGNQCGWPAPSEDFMRRLIAAGIRCVGTDAPSIAPLDDLRTVHEIGLSHGVVFIECLTRLGDLPSRGAFFIFLPLKLSDGSGAPGRAIALTPPDSA